MSTPVPAHAGMKVPRGAEASVVVDSPLGSAEGEGVGSAEGLGDGLGSGSGDATMITPHIPWRGLP